MEGPPFKLDRRSPADLLDAWGKRASRLRPRPEQAPPGTETPESHWLRELFVTDEQSGRHELRVPDEPSSALLAGVAQAFGLVLDRFNELPDELRLQYLERIGFKRRAATPQHVVVSFPRTKSPVLVPARSRLRTTPDKDGNNRSFETLEAIVLQPTQAAAIVGYQRLADGRALGSFHMIKDGVLDHAIWPFGAASSPETDELYAEMYLAGPMLAAIDPGSVVRLRFQGLTPTGAAAHALLSSFQIEISTAKDPAPINEVLLDVEGDDVTLTFTAPSGAAPPSEPIPPIAPDAPWIRLRPVVGQKPPPPTLGFRDIQVSVEWSGRTPPTLEHNRRALDVSAPFLPFGPAPRSGDAFYIGDEGLFRWPIESLNIGFTPPDAGTVGFRADPIADDQGHTPGRLVWETNRDDRWSEIPVAPGQDASDDQVIGAPTPLSPPTQPDAPRALADPAPSGERFVRCRLQGTDFGLRRFQADQRAYVDAQVRLAHELAEYASRGVVGKRFAKRPKQDPSTPPVAPEPPRFAGVSLSGRSAWCSLRVWPGLDLYSGPSKMRPIRRTPAPGEQYRPLSWPTPEVRGFLFFGLRHVAPGAQIDCYLHIHASPSQQREQKALMAYAVASDGFRELDFVDGTDGLSHSGFLRVSVPSKGLTFASPVHLREASELDDESLFWLALEIEDAPSAGKIAQISFNSVEAVGLKEEADEWAGRDIQTGTSLTPAKAKSGVSDPVTIETLIASNPGESQFRFERRAAGRMRHRDRALSPWDVERLVLDRFSHIKLVRCVRPTVDEGITGKFTVFVAPDVTDRFPLVNKALREQVYDFLMEQSAFVADLRVCDPEFREVRVQARIKVAPGFILADAATSINDALCACIHPVNSFGGTQAFDMPLLQSDLLRLLNAREEVAYIEMLRFEGEGSDVDIVYPSKLSELLTSAETHDLELFL